MYIHCCRLCHRDDPTTTTLAFASSSLAGLQLWPQSRQNDSELGCEILEHDLDQGIKIVLVFPAPVLSRASVVEHHWPRIR